MITPWKFGEIMFLVKKTLTQLSLKYNYSIPKIRDIINLHKINEKFPCQEIKPREIFLIIDAFYRKRSSGILLFRSPNLRRNLLWFDVKSERIDYYEYGVKVLIKFGFKIKGITVDGKKGVIERLKNYCPIQYCQFHQMAIVTRYLTRNPKSEPSIKLRLIALTLKNSSYHEFKLLLDNWYKKYKFFLKEKTYHPSGKWSYTHKRLRSCYRSLNNNLKYLFIYQNIKNMPNTTNSLDGSISHLRTLLRVHRGTILPLQRKITQELLRGTAPQNFH